MTGIYVYHQRGNLVIGVLTKYMPICFVRETTPTGYDLTLIFEGQETEGIVLFEDISRQQWKNLKRMYRNFSYEELSTIARDLYDELQLYSSDPFSERPLQLESSLLRIFYHTAYPS